MVTKQVLLEVTTESHPVLACARTLPDKSHTISHLRFECTACIGPASASLALCHTPAFSCALYFTRPSLFLLLLVGAAARVGRACGPRLVVARCVERRGA